MFPVASCRMISRRLRWSELNRPPSGPAWVSYLPRRRVSQRGRTLSWRSRSTWTLHQSYLVWSRLKSIELEKLLYNWWDQPLVKGWEGWWAVVDFRNSRSNISLLAAPKWTTPERFGRVLMESRTCFSLMWWAGGGQDTSCKVMREILMRSEDQWESENLHIVGHQPGAAPALLPALHLAWAGLW